MFPNPAQENLAVPYYPTLFEFTALVATVLLVCGFGIIIFRKWTQRGLTPPLWLAAATWVAALGVHVLVVGYLWGKAGQGDEPQELTVLLYSKPDASRELTILLYGLALWIPTVVYYSHVLLNSMATRSVEHLSWLGIPAGEFESYREARRLAAMGDIEGAVSVYQTYEEGRPRALLAAANLLELDGQFPRSAEILQKVISESGQETRYWAEASFRIAKLYEYHLGRQSQALALYNQIVERARNSEHGRLAASKIANLQTAGYEPTAGSDADEAEEHEAETDQAEPDSEA
jgi:tetratricopeptide (TPR) repeat protein